MRKVLMMLSAALLVAGFAAVIFTYVGVDFLLPQIHGGMG